MKKQTNTNFSKIYIHHVKVLFPIIRNTEKAYLRQMRKNIKDYCEQFAVSSMDELYEEFGKPQDVVYSYYSLMDMVPLFSYIRLRRIIKYFLTFICVILLAIMVFIGTILYQEHMIFMRQEIVMTETTISD